ncbi:hypothetical protein [Sphingomonas sp. KR3-1]|uniref:phosphoribosyltransferase-like protein n=1 Tax=Sphingomonas sp. KR3-1 TaxID=3156611 RepID=UPI0032B4266B
MLLSDTPRGLNWLGNFDVAERESAALLLDSIELVGQDALQIGLSGLIESLADSLPNPIALVPVRELAPGQRYFQHGRDAPARLLLPQSFPGSEAIVAAMLNGVRRAAGVKQPFVEAPSLKNMRGARCRTILLVDDFSGSGGRIKTFYRGFKAHPTLRSWLSYQRIEYHVACYAATPLAFRNLQRTFGEEHVHVHTMCPTIGTRKWDEDQIQRIKRLCTTYASTAIQTSPLGYGDTGGLLAFSHSAPNNLPVILWQMFRAGHPGWAPFFLDKGIPDDVRALFSLTDRDRQRASAVRQLQQPRLSLIDWSQLRSQDTQDMMLVLAAIARRPRDRHLVAQLTGLSLPAVRRAADLCTTFKLIDRSFHLTDRGRAELQHAKKITLPGDDFLLNGSDEPYYPRQLRAGR